MKKILIVVDMQNDFITGSLGSKDAEAIVPAVVNKIKEYIDKDDQIFLTQDTHYNNYLDTQEGKNLPVPHCIKETPGWDLADEIEEAIKGKNCLRLFKNTFGCTGLIPSLSLFDSKDTEIELVGLCTDICVISNAMIAKAALPEAKITVDASCCAGVTPESHKNALNAMKAVQINVINE